MMRLVFLLLAGCAAASGMTETTPTPTPTPADEPDTEPLPLTPKKKIADPRVPLDAGHEN